MRRGLAKTLAIMGVHGAEVPSTALSAREVSARIVRKLLEKANADWRLWGSLSGCLPLLAEAAPDQFLEAAEEGLQGPEPFLGRLFQSGDDPAFASHLHTGILQALEVLAWSPDHLGRVVSLLARLDLVDPGRSYARNRADAVGQFIARSLFSRRSSEVGCQRHPRRWTSGSRCSTGFGSPMIPPLGI